MSRGKETDIVNRLLGEIEKVFGISKSVFKNFVIYEKRKGEFWITSNDSYDFELTGFVRKGFKFATVYTRGFRLSSFAILLFGKYATKNFIELSEEERERFIRGEDLVNRWQNVRGQVIVRYKGIPLGSAAVTGDILKNQVPRAARIRTGF